MEPRNNWCVLCLFAEDYFKDCRLGAPGFDACIREALNGIRPYFKTGLPKYNVAPFDPFFAKEVSARRGPRNLGFTITLKNITESGWSASKVTKFVSDLKNYKVGISAKKAYSMYIGFYIRITS